MTASPNRHVWNRFSGVLCINNSPFHGTAFFQKEILPGGRGFVPDLRHTFTQETGKTDAKSMQPTR
jgi:hypothetical protein